MKKKTFMAAIISLAVLISIVAGVQVVKIAKAEPRTIIVPDDYSTIQSAINAANSGDTVFVKSGIYPGNLIINKSISVIGENRDQTIIDAHKMGGHVVLITDAPFVTFANFTLGNSMRPEIRGSGSGYDTIDGIRVSFGSEYTKIINNLIVSIPFGDGIRAKTSNLLIERNTIINCSIYAVRAEYFNTLIVNNEYAYIGITMYPYADFKPISSDDERNNNTVEGNHEITITSIPSPFPKNYPSPVISIISPQKDGLYNMSDVPLAFAVNHPTLWVGYSLNGEANMSVTGNTTLAGLSNGRHNIQLFGNDTLGNYGVSEIIYFTVNVPFPLTLAVGAVVAVIVVAVVGAGLLFCFKKRKR